MQNKLQNTDTSRVPLQFIGLDKCCMVICFNAIKGYFSNIKSSISMTASPYNAQIRMNQPDMKQIIWIFIYAGNHVKYGNKFNSFKIPTVNRNLFQKFLNIISFQNGILIIYTEISRSKIHLHFTTKTHFHQQTHFDLSQIWHICSRQLLKTLWNKMPERSRIVSLSLSKNKISKPAMSWWPCFLTNHHGLKESRRVSSKENVCFH